MNKMTLSLLGLVSLLIVTGGHTAQAQTVGDITICGRPGTDRFNACYYEGKNFDTFKMQREDQQVNFDWGASSPNPVVPSNNFSVRWLGLFDFESGVYEFTVTTDDGVRLNVDNETIIDKWFDQPATTYTVRKTMEAAQNRGVILEYYENSGDAAINLSWRKISDDTVPPPPSSSVGYYPQARPSDWYILPGQTLSFSGNDFAPHEIIRIQSGNTTIATISANNNGNFTTQNVLDIPYSWQNSVRTFTITGTTSKKPLEFNIGVGTFYPQINPSQWWVEHDQGVSVSGKGFAPYEQVKLFINGNLISQAGADSGGNVSFSFTTPDSGSTATIAAHGNSTGLSSTRIIFLH